MWWAEHRWMHWWRWRRWREKHATVWSIKHEEVVLVHHTLHVAHAVLGKLTNRFAFLALASALDLFLAGLLLGVFLVIRFLFSLFFHILHALLTMAKTLTMRVHAKVTWMWWFAFTFFLIG